MNIAFLYNVKHNENYSVTADQTDLEFDSENTIAGIAKAIEDNGHKVIRIEADLNAYENLKKRKHEIDLVFNIAEGLGGDARESQVPIFCEMLGIPYTHSSPTTHALKIHKHLTKAVLQTAGIKVPQSVAVTKSTYKNADYSGLKFPIIIKPNTQGSSKGIFNDSIVNNKEGILKAVERVLKEFDYEALVEEYIDGREFTVAVLGTPLKVLPIIEQRFDFLPEGFNKIAGYELKWIYEDKLEDLTQSYICPAKLSEEITKLIQQTTLTVCYALDVKDCARLDYRLDKDNNLYFLEINTLPGMIPDPTSVSYFPLAARVSGLEYKALINEIIQSAIARYLLVADK